MDEKAVTRAILEALRAWKQSEHPEDLIGMVKHLNGVAAREARKQERSVS